jgi:pyrroline-5-carboxylate reductase
LLLVGCGKMGGALLDGWLAADMVEQAVIIEPVAAAAARFADRARLRVCASANAVPGDFAPDAVVLAVKPQMMDEALRETGRHVHPGSVVLSIAAGKTLGYFAHRLGDEAAVVRAMPNTPAEVGRGITVACASARVTAGHRGLCDRLLRAVGEVEWIVDESLLDAVTAVSGSGPAYVFLLIEALAHAGTAAGLPAALAMRLARATVIGSGELARQSPETAATLRQNVTSPGGTTRAALDVLMGPAGLQALFDRAVAAAAARSRELAQ